MILATVGTTHFPFFRLLRGMLIFAQNHPEQTIVIQTGFTPLPLESNKSKTHQNVFVYPFIPLDYLLKLSRVADKVVSACGEGTVLMLRNQTLHQPIYFPRDPTMKEHVDDQQIRVAKRIEKLTLGQTVYSAVELYHALVQPPLTSKKFDLTNQQSQIVNYLIDYTHEIDQG